MSLPKHQPPQISLSRTGTIRIAIEGEPDLMEQYGSKRIFSPQSLVLEFRQKGPEGEVELKNATLKGPVRLKGGGLSEARIVTHTSYRTVHLTPEGDVASPHGMEPFPGLPGYVEALVREYWPKSL